MLKSITFKTLKDDMLVSARQRSEQFDPEQVVLHFDPNMYCENILVINADPKHLEVRLEMSDTPTYAYTLADFEASLKSVVCTEEIDNCDISFVYNYGTVLYYDGIGANSTINVVFEEKRYLRADVMKMTYYIMTHLLNADDTIEFATARDFDDGNGADELVDDGSFTGWFFAKRMYISNYDSSYILVDYCGGGDAIAIPLEQKNGFSNCDDEMIIGRLRDLFDMVEIDHAWIEHKNN